MSQNFNATALPRVVVALDKFKGSVTAAVACRSLVGGLRECWPEAVVEEVPIADGGDGTLEVLLAHGYEPRPVVASGPTGEPGVRRIGRRAGDAFVELAETCGLQLLPGAVLEPLRSSTVGLGEAALAALDAGATSVSVGLGGSASTDGGIGALQSLGATVLDAMGQPCLPGAAGLLDVAVLDLGTLDERARAARWKLLVDVDSPLCGPHGAARMFGPQKGLTDARVSQVEAAMEHWADLLEAATGRDVRNVPGAGAAGGTAAALVAALGADMQQGASFVIDQIGLEKRVASATLVITGEGRWDEQSIRGKGPGVALTVAQRLGVDAVLAVGSISQNAEAARGAAAVYALSDLQPDLRLSIANAAPLLWELGRRIGRDFAYRHARSPVGATKGVKESR